ncbi:MAG: gliding motility-associated C-terminal domain-containing protein [Flavobacteriales bacterium]|nr:gliding motility-associated C-terminal domain-containing protein [Flavobacteriales bacterium]
MKFIGLFLLLLITVHITGQITFLKSYGNNEDDYGTYVLQTSDQGYAMCINTPTNPSQNNEINIGVIKTDETGEYQWIQEYGILNSCLASKLIQTTDGGYIITGVAGDFGMGGERKAFLLKLNLAGLPQWCKFYTISISDRGVDVLELKSGGYLLIVSAYDNINTEQILVIKTDGNGNPLWDKIISAQGELIPVRCGELSNGDLIVAASRMNVFTDIVLMRLNASGNLIWSKVYSTTYDDMPTSLRINDLDEIWLGGYSFFTNSNFDGFLLKCDEYGIIKNKIFLDGGTSQGEIIRDICIANGRIAAIGDLGGMNERDVFLALYNTNGTKEWIAHYPISPNFTNYPYALQFLPGKGFIWTGDIRLPTAQRDAALVKTDLQGNAGCFSESINLFTTAQPLIEANITLTVSDPIVNVASHTPIVLVPNISRKTECEYITPVAQFDTTQSIENCPNRCLSFKDQTKYEPTSWRWFFPGAIPDTSNEQNPQNICYNASGTYSVTLIATNEFTSDTIVKNFTVGLSCPIVVPNVFSPNDDGINDILFIPGLPLKFHLIIYNRWGNAVFETEDPNQLWNGKINNTGEKATSGVYFYVLKRMDTGEVQKGTLSLFN